MCGRFCQALTGETLIHHFQINNVNRVTITSSYNVAPSQIVLAIVSKDEHRVLSPMRWGLIPAWADSMKMGAKLINARSETIDQKPAFRQSFYKYRCIIPANGFYEWKKIDKQKQAYFIKLSGDTPMALAGIWAVWKNGTNEKVASLSIVTTQANEILSNIHNRMPVILSQNNYDKWLNASTERNALKCLLKPYPSDAIEAYPVSAYVN
ncbi:MAG: YoaM, partial [Candidatus Magnetoglobus multicellularis str. Araruama]